MDTDETTVDEQDYEAPAIVAVTPVEALLGGGGSDLQIE
jgi:hypothetical protein